MLAAGIDVGQHAIKVVVLGTEGPLASGTHVNELDSDSGARQALGAVLAGTGIALEDVGAVASTGLGRKEVSFAQVRKTQETCAARGAFHRFRRPCTVLDGGAGGCRAVRVGPGGKVLGFAANSKCASGTGAFLEVACEVLRIDLRRLDQLAGAASEVAKVSTTCAVFAESAIISNVHYGYPLESVCAGVCDSVVSRLMDVVSQVGVEEALIFCGGLAESKTIARMLEARVQAPVHVPEDPVLTTALGAALLAS